MSTPASTTENAAPDAVTQSQRDQERIDHVFAAQRLNRWVVAHTTAAERIAKLERLRAWVERNAERIRDAGRRDFQKPGPEVDMTEIYPVVAEIRHAVRHLHRWMRPHRVRPTLALATTRAWIQYEPKGVVLVMAPWNYAFNLTVSPLVSALAAGNCVCIKPSELSPAKSALMADMVAELFPEDQVALFEGEVDVATRLLAKPFDHIFFTGSPAVGKVVMRAAAENLASVTLELGGKSPAIVDPTADLRDAADKISFGNFMNNGQTCIAPDYVLVHESRVEAFTEALIADIRKDYGETSEARQASPDYARVVNRRHFDRLKRILDDSLAAGARIVLGGVTDERDLFFDPTVLVDVTPDSPVMRGEIFGPILPLLAYRTLDEALALINSKDKPLALYVFSRDRETVRRVLSGTSSGGACINEVNLQFLHLNLPFGGVNTSGFGNSHGFFGFKAFSHERAVLKHHRFSPIKLMAPPYGKLARRLIALTLKYF